MLDDFRSHDESQKKDIDASKTERDRLRTAFIQIGTIRAKELRCAPSVYATAAAAAEARAVMMRV